MNKKFLIILFVTIFYNGVSNSTPIDGQISEVRLPEEKPPTVAPTSTVVVDHLNKKVDPVAVAVPAPAPAPAQNISNPVSQNASSTAQSVSEAPMNISTAHSDPKNNATNSAQNATLDAAGKITGQTAEGKNASQTTGDNKNANKPADEKPVTLPAPANKNSGEATAATPAGQTSVAPSTPTAAGPNATTTAKPPVTKPTATPVPPTSNSKDVIAEQNTPAPAQEKHFDGPSFIGGIVLTIGLTAIGFIAFKYYKSGKIDMNYRTL